MSQAALLERGSVLANRTDILVVSEDPFFIREANAVLTRAGGDVIGCLGPAHSECDLYKKGSCSLARHVAFALVDSPPEGDFKYRTFDVGSGDYAAALQLRHPDPHVILCGARVGSGPTGSVATVETRQHALYVLTRLLRAKEKLHQPSSTRAGRKQ